MNIDAFEGRPKAITLFTFDIAHVSVPPFLPLELPRNLQNVAQVTWMGCHRETKTKKPSFLGIYQFLAFSPPEALFVIE